MTNNKVNIWRETITIPTYQTATPEKAPLFIENRAYQGSSGKVYPLGVTEKITDTKQDVEYLGIFLENDYLKILILPELGGRIQRALDKTNGYDFVYYNHVIKPALVGLTGSWISGGIEFNWPQHHRPSTYSPVDWRLQENEDGSASVYLSEIDKMYGTKGMAIISLHPERAYIEIKGRLYNNTELPQTFLWWANPAVPVNDYTYSVFPPDVNAVMDHGKRAVSTFPIATGEYYKYDYSAGVDISMYKNIKVPTSYMAAHSDYDFIGSYDSQKEAGLLHVADHHISPGKKQWTWGSGDFGKTWDGNLTDEDGPYIELMTGVYTDNQPDFTWLKPHEEKTFVQYFMPYKGVGRIKNATRDAALNLEITDGNGQVFLYTSAAWEDLQLTVLAPDSLQIYQKTLALSPTEYFTDTFPTSLTSGEGCVVTVKTKDFRELAKAVLPYRTPEPTPEPAEALADPADLKSLEDLYLAGQHLEQYRHATREPADYYEEGLRRDPSDIRLNNAYGLLKLRRGEFKTARNYFQTAIKKQTWKTPNPYSGECYFNLGLTCLYLGNYAQAYDAFYKSTWSYETQAAGFYQLALLATRNDALEEALEFAENSLIRNWHDMKTRTLKIALLRLLGRDNSILLMESKKIDPLYPGLIYEESLINKKWDYFCDVLSSSINHILELALIYLDAGLYEDALKILQTIDKSQPLPYYYQGYICCLKGDTDLAREYFLKGEAASYISCFPNKLVEILIFETVIRQLKEAPLAHYYLGNILYDKKQYSAAASHWETAAVQKKDLAMAWRNLSIAYFNKKMDKKKALTAIETAWQIEPDYPRFLLEYDQLQAKNNVPAAKRLSLLEDNLNAVKQRDALYLEYITLLNLTGQYQKALDHLNNHHFHPWEGGEGKVICQYRFALTEIAITLINTAKYEHAIELLLQTFTYPQNLGEGKLPNVQDTIAEYYLGICYQALGNLEKAREFFSCASTGLDEPTNVLYYYDQPADTMLYQGLAHLELGNSKMAKKNFHQLKAYGSKHLFDRVSYDFFAVSLPEFNVYQDDISDNNITYCKYLIALGEIGLGNYQESDRILDEILMDHPDHQGVFRHKRLLCRIKDKK